MATQSNILIVDDDPAFCELKSNRLTSMGFSVQTIQDPTKAQQLIDENNFDLILTDLQMEKMTGIELLQLVKKNYPEIPVILLTAFSSVESAVTATKEGAFDYLNKDCPFEELLFKINRALEKKYDLQELENLRKTLKERYAYKNIIGKNEKIQEVYDAIEMVRDIDVTVLIRGETGTGKELVAKSIHFGGKRKDKPFIILNCAAISETLIESELFGHEKGAFTGAIKEKPGKLELANGGTIFLDEIGDMSIHLQAKLLRVLQDKKFERVGGTKILSTDARIISATNRDLEKYIEENKFREDLYHRINAITIHLPPLRDRVDDIKLLSEYFFAVFNKEYGKNITEIPPKIMDFFMTYSWPGNIRELENVIRKFVLASKDSIISEDILNKHLGKTRTVKIPSSKIDKSDSLPQFLENSEKEYILTILKQFNGRLKIAAERAGIDRRTLYKKMKHYKIQKEDFMKK